MNRPDKVSSAYYDYSTLLSSPPITHTLQELPSCSSDIKLGPTVMPSTAGQIIVGRMAHAAFHLPSLHKNIYIKISQQKKSRNFEKKKIIGYDIFTDLL